MPVCFQCPRCDRLLSTATRKAGRLVACPGCEGPVLVPLLSRPVSSPAGGGLRPRRLVLLSAIVAVLTALAIPAGEVAGLTEISQASDAAFDAVPSAPPNIAAPAVQSVAAPQAERTQSAPRSTETTIAAATAETGRAVVEPASPLVVFVPIMVPEPVPAAVPPPAAPEPPAASATAGGCGTSIEFERTPLLASQKARKERKLLVLLHISGNFEESKFT